MSGTYHPFLQPNSLSFFNPNDHADDVTCIHAPVVACVNLQKKRLRKTSDFGALSVRPFQAF